MDNKLLNYIKLQIKVYENELVEIARKIFISEHRAKYEAKLLGIVYGLMIIEMILTLYNMEDLPEYKQINKQVGYLVDEI